MIPYMSDLTWLTHMVKTRLLQLIVQQMALFVIKFPLSHLSPFSFRLRPSCNVNCFGKDTAYVENSERTPLIHLQLEHYAP